MMFYKNHLEHWRNCSLKGREVVKWQYGKYLCCSNNSVMFSYMSFINGRVVSIQV